MESKAAVALDVFSTRSPGTGDELILQPTSVYKSTGTRPVFQLHLLNHPPRQANLRALRRLTGIHDPLIPLVAIISAV